MRGKYEYLLLSGEALQAAERFFESCRQFMLKRDEFVKSLDALPDYLVAREGEVLAVTFREPPGKGWKESKRRSGYWVPDKRYRAGKELAEKFGSFRRPRPYEVFKLVEPCGFESSNIQPLETPSANGALIANGTLHVVGEQTYLLMPHREFNESRKRKRTPQPLPPSIRLVREWEYLKAVDEAQEKEAPKGRAKARQRAS